MNGYSLLNYGVDVSAYSNLMLKSFLLFEDLTQDLEDSHLEKKFLEIKLQQQQRESEEDSKWLAEEESNFSLLAVSLV